MFEALILEYGTRISSHGAEIVILDKAARKRIRAALGGERGLRVFDRYWNAAPYLVVANDNRVITTGYRNRRVKRP
jgi:hypothetical protein